MDYDYTDHLQTFFLKTNLLMNSHVHRALPQYRKRKEREKKRERKREKETERERKSVKVPLQTSLVFLEVHKPMSSTKKWQE